MQASKSEIVKVRTMEPPDVSSAPNAVLTGKLRAQRVIYPCAALCYALFMLLILRHAENQRICLEFSYYAQLPVVPQIRCKQ